jgi:hypothetical protein
MTRVLEPGGLFYISEPCLEETPLRRALRWGWRLRPGRRSPRPSTAAPKSVEAPISSDELRAALERLDLEFDMRFLTHLHPLREALPESLYTLAVRLVSWPWRHRRGDLVFVFGRRRTSPHA